MWWCWNHAVLALGRQADHQASLLYLRFPLLAVIFDHWLSCKEYNHISVA